MNHAILNIKNWLHENQMEPNIKETHVLNFRGEVSATLNRSLKVPCRQQRALDLGVKKLLSWNAKQRTTKAIKAYRIKCTLSPSCNLSSELNAYVGYVIPVITFASQAWMPSRSNMHDIEKVQKLATKYIHCSGEDYKHSSLKVNLLPLSRFMEMLDLLYLLSLIRVAYDMNPGSI